MGMRWDLCGVKCAISCLLVRLNIFSCVHCARLFLIQGLRSSFLRLASLDCSVGFVCTGKRMKGSIRETREKLKKDKDGTEGRS